MTMMAQALNILVGAVGGGVVSYLVAIRLEARRYSRSRRERLQSGVVILEALKREIDHGVKTCRQLESFVNRPRRPRPNPPGPDAGGAAQPIFEDVTPGTSLAAFRAVATDGWRAFGDKVAELVDDAEALGALAVIYGVFAQVNLRLDRVTDFHSEAWVDEAGKFVWSAGGDLYGSQNDFERRLGILRSKARETDRDKLPGLIDDRRELGERAKRLQRGRFRALLRLLRLPRALARAAWPRSRRR